MQCYIFVGDFYCFRISFNACWMIICPFNTEKLHCLYLVSYKTFVYSQIGIYKYSIRYIFYQALFGSFSYLALFAKRQSINLLDMDIPKSKKSQICSSKIVKMKKCWCRLCRALEAIGTWGLRGGYQVFLGRSSGSQRAKKFL